MSSYSQNLPRTFFKLSTTWNKKAGTRNFNDNIALRRLQDDLRAQKEKLKSESAHLGEMAKRERSLQREVSRLGHSHQRKIKAQAECSGRMRELGALTAMTVQNSPEIVEVEFTTPEIVEVEFTSIYL